LTTLQIALVPQTPGQGSLHFSLKHALDRSQSEFCEHSGLQIVYGSPKYSGMHEQDPAPFFSLQIAFAPQGEGLQGSIVSIGWWTK
jgi:hypothetical protein